MVDLMNLLSDVLIGSFQMLMLNDLGKNMFPCIYVPIVADQEIERAKKILEITNANIVLTTVAENSEYMSGKAIARACGMWRIIWT